MHELLQFLGDHWLLTIVIVAIVVGGISDILDGRTKLARITGEKNALQAQLEAKGSKPGNLADAYTINRMARLLDKVQEADNTIPQLNRELRLLIDTELEDYHKPPAIKPKKGKQP